MQKRFLRTAAVASAFALLVSRNGSAQYPNVRFEHLTTDNGLSHSFVRCIVQDEDGFLWFGTFDGLNKYDGYAFTVYQNRDNDSTSLTSNIIRSLLIDKEGRLWVGTTKGLCLYDRDRDAFFRCTRENGYGLGEIDVVGIGEDSRGHLWIGTEGQGLFWLDPKNRRVEQYIHREGDLGSISGNSVRSVFEDSRGRLWIPMIGGGVDRFHPETKSFTHFRHRKNAPASLIGNRVYAIVEDKKGVLWFACYEDGLSSVHVDSADNPVFTNRVSRPWNRLGFQDNPVRVLRPDRNGGLWIGMEDGGLDWLHPDGKTFIHYETDAADPSSLSNNSIYAVFQDRIGDIWIGTYMGGVNVIHRAGETFKHYKHDFNDPHSLSLNFVTDFQEDADGVIWITTDGGGLNRFDPRTGRWSCFNSKNTNLNSDAVLCVCRDSGNGIWIGTWEGGISRFNRRTASFTAYTTGNSGLSNDNVFDIVDGGRDRLWIATQRGLNRFNKRNRSFHVYTQENSGLVANQVECIRKEPGGRLLIGSILGFGIFDPETETFVNYRHDPRDSTSLSNDFITSVCGEDSAAFWIATTHELNRFDAGSKRFRRYSTRQGLPSDLIFGVERDRRGFLWISTNGGLSRLDPKTNRFRNYTKEDGLQSNTFIKKSHAQTRSRQMVFGGINGFNIFDPEKIVENRSVPPVVITEFRIFNKPVPVGVKGSPLKKQIGQTDEIVLSFRQTTFSFQFAALNYVIPSKNQYAYFLEGFEKEWNAVGSQRQASYTNIPPGKYLFRIKASNNDGVWNESGKSVRIIITPPFWQTTAFRIGFLCLLAGLLVAGHKMRTSRIRKMNRELEQRVHERTAQLDATNKELEAFAYSVSHDLRAPLRSMDGFGQALLEDYAERFDERGRDFLRRIRNASQHMSLLIDDLLKLSRLARSDMVLRQTDLSALVESVAEEFRYSDPAREVKFVIQEKVVVEADPSLLIVLVRNLIDNAWKFTSKRRGAIIEFGAKREKDRTVYYIKDNGIGFDMAYSEKLFEAFQRQHTEFEGTGIGLATVQRIVHRHGGRTWAEGKENEGAVFYFTLGQP